MGFHQEMSTHSRCLGRLVWIGLAIHGGDSKTRRYTDGEKRREKRNWVGWKWMYEDKKLVEEKLYWREGKRKKNLVGWK